MEATHALLIGIDQYFKLDIPALKGCEQDAQALAAFLVTRLQAAESNITLLLSSAKDVHELPTRQNIITALRRIGERAGVGDRVVIFFAGHGSRREREQGSNSETIVPMDGRLESIYDICDVELSVLLQGITCRTDNVIVFLDSCHSSGGTRDHQYVRKIDPDMRPQPRIEDLLAALGVSAASDEGGAQPRVPAGPEAMIPRGALPGGESGWNLNPENRYLVLAACQADQDSVSQMMGDGKHHGLFTWCLLDVLNHHAHPRMRWIELYDLVRDKVVKMRREQVPAIEGNLQRYVFGGAWTPRDSGFRAVAHGDMWELAAGEVGGLAPGAIIGLYPSRLLPLSTGTTDERLATLRVTSASGLQALASVIEQETQLPVPVTARGYVLAPPSEQRLPIRVSGPAGDLTAAVESALLVVREPAELEVACDQRSWRVVRIADQRTIIEGANSPGAARTIRIALEHYSRYWRTLNRAPHSGSPAGQALTLRVIDALSGKPIELAGDCCVLRAGTEFLIQIVNEGSTPLYATLVNCTASVMVEYLYPYGEETAIQPGQWRLIGSGWVRTMTPESAVYQPQLRPFVATLPDGCAAVVDRLRVFGTTSVPLGLRDQLELIPAIDKLLDLPEVSGFAPAGSLQDVTLLALAPETVSQPEDLADTWIVGDLVLEIMG